MTRPTTIRLAAVAGGVALILGAAGCGGGSSGNDAAAQSTFDNQGGHPIKCMAHQTKAPVAIDHPGAKEDPESVLAFLSYYTANGNKPYCDGKPATSTDRQWLALYLDGGSSRGKVRQALSTTP